jgi:hypothetical protein
MPEYTVTLTRVVEADSPAEATEVYWQEMADLDLGNLDVEVSELDAPPIADQAKAIAADLIARHLSGKEWEAADLETVAEILTRAGYVIDGPTAEDPEPAGIPHDQVHPDTLAAIAADVAAEQDRGE